MSEQERKQPTRDEVVSTQDTPSPRDVAEKDTKLGFSMLSKVTLGIVIIVSLVISISCLMQFNQNKQDIEDLKKDLQKRNEYIREMQDILNSEMDDEYIIEQAKDKFGHYFPDEEIFYQDVND